MQLLKMLCGIVYMDETVGRQVEGDKRISRSVFICMYIFLNVIDSHKVILYSCGREMIEYSYYDMKQMHL